MNGMNTESDAIHKVIHEHDALRDKLRRMHSVLAQRVPAPDEIETLLKEFRSALLVHFVNEEDAGFFEEVTAHAPRLASRAGMLCNEHRQLLREADELCRFASAGTPSVSWWRELNGRCHEFSRRLMHHEHEENSLLQDAHQSDIGAND
jgi:iron-sulfur cluster repair protein YtfE (RIC family)